MTLRPFAPRFLAHALLALAAASFLLLGCAGTRRQDGAATAALVAELRAQADRWGQAIVRKDRAAIEANMADDFRQIGDSGNVETRTSFVEGLVSPDLVIDPHRVEDFEVRPYGDVALLIGRTRMTGTYQGKRFASHYRYIDI